MIFHTTINLALSENSIIRWTKLNFLRTKISTGHSHELAHILPIRSDRWFSGSSYSSRPGFSFSQGGAGAMAALVRQTAAVNLATA